MGMVRLVICVDDIVITGNDGVEINKLKAYMRTDFEMRDLGTLKYFLGIEVARSKTGLSKTGKLGAQPVDTPIEQNHVLHSNSAELRHDPKSYQRPMEKLINLTITRPYISYAVSLTNSVHLALSTEF